MPAWFIEWAETVNLWGILLILSAIASTIVCVVLFVKKGWPWLKAFAKAIIKTSQVIDAVQELPEFIARTDKTLETQNERIGEIHHEVHYNNGSSVKDAVRRVENGVADLRRRLDDSTE